MPTTLESKEHATYDTALGMLRRGKCGADVIVGYLTHALNRDDEAQS